MVVVRNCGSRFFIGGIWGGVGFEKVIFNIIFATLYFTTETYIQNTTKIIHFGFRTKRRNRQLH